MYQTDNNTEKGCILGIITLLSFILFSFYSYTTYMNCGFLPKTNPTVEGKIRKSSVEKSTFERRGYSIKIEYEYQVGETSYISNTICCGSTANELEKGIIDKYPVGSKVTVYYRKNNPRVSAIEPRIARGQKVMLLFSGFFFFALIGYNFYHTQKN